MFNIRLLDSKLQIFERDIMPTELSAFIILTLIHINNVRQTEKKA